MKWLFSFLRTSIGRKQLMSASGLFMSFWLVGHLSGNLLLYKGATAFNAYAAWLESQPWLIPFEILMILIIAVHMFFAIQLTLENKAARPVAYAVKDASDAGLASRTMIYSGGLLLIFIVLHLVHFKFGPHHEHEQGLYGLVVAELANPIYGIPYIIAMILVGLHLIHGVQSAFQSFGVNHPVHTPLIKKLCTLLAIVLSVGFSLIPIWAMITGGGNS